MVSSENNNTPDLHLTRGWPHSLPDTTASQWKEWDSPAPPASSCRGLGEYVSKFLRKKQERVLGQELPTKTLLASILKVF